MRYDISFLHDLATTMKAAAKFIVKGLAAIVLALVLSIVASTRDAQPELFPPKPGEPSLKIFVVSHGFHTGLIISRTDLSRLGVDLKLAAIASVAQTFSNYDSLEIGWGDANFYRYAPSLSSVSVGMAIKALMMPGNRSVLHVVGLKDAPRVNFPRSEIAEISVSASGFAALVTLLDRTFEKANSGEPIDEGHGLYGPSRFFAAQGEFGIWRVCNHFVSELLRAAGLPTNYIASTLPAGLLLDLRMRAGAVFVPIN